MAGLTFLLSCAPLAAVAKQQHRFEVRCMVEGYPAKVVEDASLDTPARAQYLNGQRTIAVNPKLKESLSAVVQTFLVAHECGH